MSLKTLVEELTNELSVDNWIDNLPEDKLMDVMKTINPYAVTLPVKANEEESFSISYTNQRQEFNKKLVTSSMIGFLNRMLTEYECPDNIKPVSVEEYMNDPTCADPPASITDPKMRQDYLEYKHILEKKCEIWKFLQYVFDFNPDAHIGSSLATNVKDPTRKTPNVQAVRKAIQSKKNTLREVPRASYEIKSIAELEQRNNEVQRTVDPPQEALAMIPPLDYFTKYDRYLEEHYEEYIECVNALYGLKPDIDLMMIVYDHHENEERAKRFKERHMDQVIAPITNIKKNRWLVLGPYRENREKVDFYNKNTEVLKEMVEQRERDAKVATDIMKKRIKIKKAKNIEKDGPDDKNFKSYLKANKPDIALLGGEHVTDETDDCPEDAVEVSVFTVGDSGRQLKVGKIYNQIEKPVESAK